MIGVINFNKCSSKTSLLFCFRQHCLRCRHFRNKNIMLEAGNVVVVQFATSHVATTWFHSTNMQANKLLQTANISLWKIQRFFHCWQVMHTFNCVRFIKAYIFYPVYIDLSNKIIKWKIVCRRLPFWHMEPDFVENNCKNRRLGVKKRKLTPEKTKFGRVILEVTQGCMS